MHILNDIIDKLVWQVFACMKAISKEEIVIIQYQFYREWNQTGQNRGIANSLLHF